MLDRHVVGAALAALLALPAAAQGPAAAPPAGGAEPCEPVVPCEIPDEAAAPAEGPAELGAEARRLFDLVSCRGAPLAAGLDAKAVAAFCARQSRALATYREGFPAASAFLASLRPPGLPTTVVVPFSGDLLAALATYPDLRNVTTVSPAPAGDPRRLAGLPPGELGAALERVRAATAPLLRSAGEGPAAAGARRAFPVQLASFLTALAAHGYEPVGLRCFRVEPSGTLRYLTARELDASGPAPGACASSELTFVKRGEDPRTRLRTHRHLAADLSDAALARSPGVLAHLAGKGELVAAVRGGPPLLWRADHARVRDLLLRQAVLVVSDWTGPSPRDARKAGLVQEAHGAYQGTAGADRARDAELVALFAAQPARPLPLRYGHLDRAGHPHLLVTRRAPRR